VIKEIIFDCFGVLTQDGWLGFLKQYGTKDNLEELRYVNHQADRGVISYDNLLDEIERLTTSTRHEAHRMITTDISINEDVIEIIEKLKSSYKLGLISNVGRPIEVYLPKQIVDLFDVKTLSYEVGAIKPDKEIFDVHLESSGFSAQETVFIDDRENNCAGAEAAGIKAIWFRNEELLVEELRTLGIKI
jgi:putative hydrolase of the HAD superfamily